MATNPNFNKEELELLLLTILETRNILFDCIEMKFDHKSLEKPVNYNPRWKGKRGTLPLVEKLDKLLAIVRLHINSEETITFYDAIGTFDIPCKRKKTKVKPI